MPAPLGTKHRLKPKQRRIQFQRAFQGAGGPRVLLSVLLTPLDPVSTEVLRGLTEAIFDERSLTIHYGLQTRTHRAPCQHENFPRETVGLPRH